MNEQQAPNPSQALVNAAIVNVLLPQLYVAIDDLLDHAPNAPKELVIRAKKLLPSIYPQSLEQKPFVKASNGN